MTLNDSLAASTSAENLLFAVDIAGTLVFGVGGAMAAVNGNLDRIGIMTSRRFVESGADGVAV